ncbi:hypothetical protein D3875_09465 [Deinococcus cavernae]|uniref:Uncharacterized protein n=1 Tax=Deinococcus cavernae TaxID=2320857 RepID=A0A418V6P1_9DEIO|nr:hypothetical protein [Deinococcus cavernae]RJF71761.1 hypothetical protein D3875_09465 [Deinococcus cavernae]
MSEATEFISPMLSGVAVNEFVTPEELTLIKLREATGVVLLSVQAAPQDVGEPLAFRESRQFSLAENFSPDG